MLVVTANCSLYTFSRHLRRRRGRFIPFGFGFPSSEIGAKSIRAAPLRAFQLLRGFQRADRIQ